MRTAGGNEPYSVALHPDKKTIAVGMDDRLSIDLYDATTLGTSPPSIRRASRRFACRPWLGRRTANGCSRRPVLPSSTGTTRAAANAPSERRQQFDAPARTLRRWNCRLRVGSRARRRRPRRCPPHVADGRDVQPARTRGENFTVSADGLRGAHRQQRRRHPPMLFDLSRSLLEVSPNKVEGLQPARIDGMEVRDWDGMRGTQYRGQPLPLQLYETVRTLAIAPNAGRFVVGSDGICAPTMRAARNSGRCRRQAWPGGRNNRATDALLSLRSAWHHARGIGSTTAGTAGSVHPRQGPAFGSHGRRLATTTHPTAATSCWVGIRTGVGRKRPTSRSRMSAVPRSASRLLRRAIELRN